MSEQSPGCADRTRGKDGELSMLEAQPQSWRGCSERGRNLRFSTQTPCSAALTENTATLPPLLTPREHPRVLQSPPSPTETGHHFLVRWHLKGTIHIFISIWFIALITIVTYPPVSAALGRGKFHFPFSALKVSAPLSRVISGAHPGWPNSGPGAGRGSSPPAEHRK